MPLFRRTKKPVAVSRGVQRAIDEALQDIDRLAADGLQRFQVQVSEATLGIGTRLDVGIPFVVDAIQSAGHAVVNTDIPGWSGVAFLTVEPGYTASARYGSGQPAVAERSADGTADRLAVLGWHELLGAEAGGLDDAALLELTAPLRQRRYSGPAGEAAVLADVRTAASIGGWAAIGAWRFLANFTSKPEQEASDVLDAAIDALHGLRATNLAIHLTTAETSRYRERHGEPSQGEWGPLQLP